MWYVEKETGAIYTGDMRIGDREATAQEIAAWEQSKAPTKDERINSKLQAFGYTQEWMLDRDIGYAITLAQIGGVSEPVLYASNAAYHMAKDLKAELDAIRAKP